MRLRGAEGPLEIVVYAEAELGFQFYFEGCQIEEGAVADESLRPSAAPPRSWAVRASVPPEPQTSGDRIKSTVAGLLTRAAKMLSPDDEDRSPAIVDDQTAHALLTKADALMHVGLYDAAESVLLAGTTLFPWTAELFTHRALCAEDRGDTPEAVRRWEEVVRLFPHVALGHYRLAAALRATGDIPASQRVVDEALVDHANDAAMVGEAARVSYWAGRWSEAVARWDAAIALDGRHPDWMTERAFAQARLDESR